LQTIKLENLKAMKARIGIFFTTYLTFVLFFCLQKPLFVAWYGNLMGNISASDMWQVMWHGLPLDLSIAGYLTILPALLLITGIWTKSPWMKRVAKIYFALISIVLSVAFTANLGLYEYWGFPLDATPVFYILSSTADALASVPPAATLGGLAATVVIATTLYFVLCRIFTSRSLPPTARPLQCTAVLVLLATALFLPIRGGVTVSTMNVGRAYFSENQRLNHAAVNPVFSLLESLSKQSDFANQYRFMNKGQAARLFGELMAQKSCHETERILRTTRPNVLFIVLESFSTHLMSHFGNRQGITPNLDHIAADGLLFTHFYANSFRTDRGLVSILSGYPAQPTTSIMKYPHKTQTLPSIARTLRQKGYGTHYYYGGDADFTNMRSYLVSSQFETIVADKDFPVTSRLSKWGVPDHLVFERLLHDLQQAPARQAPNFTVLQTSSSHEPFDVPFHRFANKKLNAFAYTDSVVGRFINEFRKMPAWENTLVVLVPDHQGCWPENLGNFTPDRFRIPLILTGGALATNGHINATFGSQIDIAATLLAQMEISHRDFAFSKDLFSSRVRGFAFFCIPDAFGMASADNTVIHDNGSGRIVFDSGPKRSANLSYGKAFLQTLYDDIAHR